MLPSTQPIQQKTEIANTHKYSEKLAQIVQNSPAKQPQLEQIRHTKTTSQYYQPSPQATTAITSNATLVSPQRTKITYIVRDSSTNSIQVNPATVKRLSKSTLPHQPPTTTTTTYIKYNPQPYRPQQYQQIQQSSTIAVDPSPVGKRYLNYSTYSTNNNALNSNPSSQYLNSQSNMEESIKRSQVIYKASPQKSAQSQDFPQFTFHRQNNHQEQHQQQQNFREGVKQALNVTPSSASIVHHQSQFQFQPVQNSQYVNPQEQYNFQRNYTSLNYFKYNKNSRPTTPTPTTHSRGQTQYSNMMQSNPNNKSQLDVRSSFVSQSSQISHNNMTEIKATKKVDKLKKSVLIPEEILEKKVPFQIDLKERIEVYMKVFDENDNQFFDHFEAQEIEPNFKSIRQCLEVYETSFFLHYLKFFYLPQSHLAQDKSHMMAYHSQDPFYLSIDGMDQSITSIDIKLFGPENIPIVIIEYLEKVEKQDQLNLEQPEFESKQMIVMLHYQEQLIDWLYMISCMANISLSKESLEKLQKYDTYARRPYNYDLCAQPFKTSVSVLSQMIEHMETQQQLQTSQSQNLFKK